MSVDMSAERGSALLLMPAAVLVVLVLAAIAVDTTVMFLGERELADLTASAANDAATAALRREPFYECGRLELDQHRAQQVAATVASARVSDAVSLTAVEVSADNTADPPTVTVAAQASVRLVFSGGLPGGLRMRTVAARSTAVPQMPQDGAPQPVC